MTFLCYLEDWFQDMRQLFLYIAEKSPTAYLLFYRALIGSIIYCKRQGMIYTQKGGVSKLRIQKSFLSY